MVPLECQSAKRKKPTITISIGYQMLITKSRVCVMTLPRWRAPKRKMFFIKWKGRKETKCQWTETNSKLSQYYKWKMGRKTNRMQQTRIYRRKPKSKEIGKRSKKQVRRKTEKSRFLYCYATRDKKIFDRTKRANQLIGIGKTTTWLKIQVVSFTRQPNWLTDWCPLRCTPRRCERWFFGACSDQRRNWHNWLRFLFSFLLFYVCMCACVCVCCHLSQGRLPISNLTPHDWTIRWKENLYFGRNEGHFRLTGSVPLRILLAGLSPPGRPGTTRLCWPGKRTSKRRPVWNTWSVPRWSLSTHTHTHAQHYKPNRKG